MRDDNGNKKFFLQVLHKNPFKESKPDFTQYHTSFMQSLDFHMNEQNVLGFNPQTLHQKAVRTGYDLPLLKGSKFYDALANATPSVFNHLSFNSLFIFHPDATLAKGKSTIIFNIKKLARSQAHQRQLEQMWKLSYCMEADESNTTFYARFSGNIYRDINSMNIAIESELMFGQPLVFIINYPTEKNHHLLARRLQQTVFEITSKGENFGLLP